MIARSASTSTVADGFQKRISKESFGMDGINLAVLLGVVFLVACVVVASQQRQDRPAVAVQESPTRPQADTPRGQAIKGRVHVIDGDTIVINRIKIRLAGIDAPELDMPWGQKSKWAMVGITKGQVITAVPTGERSYDRVVATGYLPDGRDIGAELVKQGLALDLPYFSKGKYRRFEPVGARRRLANGKFGHRSNWDTPLGQRMTAKKDGDVLTRR